LVGGVRGDRRRKAASSRRNPKPGRAAPATGDAGRIIGGGAFNASLYNCLFYGHATAVNMVWLPRTIENCTFVGNGNGIYDYHASGTLLVRNCIAYSNTVNWAWRSATMVFSNTCTTPAQAGWDESNITADPRLRSYGSGFGTSHVPGDYRLRGTSPCLNAGANAPWMEDGTDLDGNRRVDRTFDVVDMGCYERIYKGATIRTR
jgi:hypothetical protein